MIKTFFKPGKGMYVIMEGWIYQNRFIPDIINRRVLGRVGYAVKNSLKLTGKLHDRPSYNKLAGRELGFKKRMFSKKYGLGGQEGMIYNTSPKKNKVSIYLVKDDLYTREQAMLYKSKAMIQIMNASKGRWRVAAEKAINETFEMIGWKK